MFFTPQIIKKIKKNNLIGRGCNNFPTAKKWLMVKNFKTPGNKFVICNISESEPGVFKDEYILAHFPDRIIDGIKIAIQTLKSSQGFIYLRPDYYSKFSNTLLKLIEKENLNIELYSKPDHSYIGGEETALINSMEGKRIEPRLKPPYPPTHGFNNQPTLVNNCETFYAISKINSNEFKNTKFFCVTEDGEKPQIKELPEDLTIKKVLQEFNHEPSDKYFYQIGGSASGDCLNSKQLNRGFKGIGSIIIYPKNKSEKDLVLGWSSFFKNESCGQCVPCREGTYRLHNMLEEYYYKNQSINQELFEDLVYSLQNSSLCPLGRVSANAILTYWKNIKKKEIFSTTGEKCDIK